MADDGGRCGKSALPEAAAEDDDGRGAGMIVIPREGAAEDGLDTQGGEECRGDHEAVKPLGLDASGEVVVLVAIDGHGGEGFAGAFPVEEVGIADGGAIHAGVLLVDGDELAGLCVGQWIEEHAVDDGEERGIGADAESQGEQGDGRKAWRFEEHAQGITQVLEQDGHGGPRERKDWPFVPFRGEWTMSRIVPWHAGKGYM